MQIHEKSHYKYITNTCKYTRKFITNTWTSRWKKLEVICRSMHQGAKYAHLNQPAVQIAAFLQTVIFIITKRSAHNFSSHTDKESPQVSGIYGSQLFNQVIWGPQKQYFQVSDVQIHKYNYTNTQIHKYTNTTTQIRKYTNTTTQLHKYTNTALFICECQVAKSNQDNFPEERKQGKLKGSRWKSHWFAMEFNLMDRVLEKNIHI